MAAGGGRGEMCRTKQKNDFEKDSPIPSSCSFFFFVLGFISQSQTILSQNAIQQAAWYG